MTDKKHINDLLKNSDKNFNENCTRDKKQIIVDGVDVKNCKGIDLSLSPLVKCKSLKFKTSDGGIAGIWCSDHTNCYFKQLARKTQECENLKAEEKYLKQCCEKAGKELAKHSFGYDGKEKNLVVQAMELNEKYEKLEKALEEIELTIKNLEKDDILTFPDFTLQENAAMIMNQCNQGYRDILDIINKAKGEGMNE